MLVLGPNDYQLQNNKSDMTDAMFSGKRELQKGGDNVAVTNPTENVVMDVDDLNDVMSLKNYNKRSSDLSNRATTAANFITSLSLNDLLIEEVSSVWKPMPAGTATMHSSYLHWDNLIEDWYLIPTQTLWDSTISY